jgi:serine/threonine protein phosphatase PrpC
MNLKCFEKSAISSNSHSFLKNLQFSSFNKKNHSISLNNLKDIYNKLPQKENIKINNKSTIAVIRKRILHAKNFSSSSNLNLKNQPQKLKSHKNSTKIEVNKKANILSKMPLLRQRKSFNEYQFNNLKKSFSKYLKIDSKPLDRTINNISETINKPIIKYNSNKLFNKTVYQIYTGKEKKTNIPISLKNKLNNSKSNIYSKIKQEKNQQLKTLNNNSKKRCQVFSVKRNSMEMEKIFLKKNDLFSNTTYNIYNVNTPIYNLISIPSFYKNKKSSSPRYNDLSILSSDKFYNKKQISLNCFIDSDIENEKSQIILKDLNMVEKDLNLKINNGSFSNTINYRNKFIHTYGNLYNDKINYFKSSNGLKNTKNNGKAKGINIMSKINNNKNINNKYNNNKCGLKKYLTYYPRKKSTIGKANHNKKQSISIIGQLNTQLLKDSMIMGKIQIKKRVMKINSCTLAGYTSPGLQKINQDNYFIKKDFLNEPEQFFIGICDGHGIHGHLISEYVSKNLPHYLNELTDESIKNAYLTIHNYLQKEKKMDSTLSGTTCTSILVSPNKVICANVGDSRAILSRYENGIYNSINLSRDHKPTETDEMKRILSNGGRIKQFYDEKIKEFIVPERIWLKNSEIPGLAMSRSLGDTIAHSVGVISEPEIINFNIDNKCQCLVIGSDGVWQYLSNSDIGRIIKPFLIKNEAENCCKEIIRKSSLKWIENDFIVDDITVSVIFLKK